MDAHSWAIYSAERLYDAPLLTGVDYKLRPREGWLLAVATADARRQGVTRGGVTNSADGVVTVVCRSSRRQVLTEVRAWLPLRADVTLQSGPECFAETVRLWYRGWLMVSKRH